MNIGNHLTNAFVNEILFYTSECSAAFRCLAERMVGPAQVFRATIIDHPDEDLAADYRKRVVEFDLAMLLFCMLEGQDSMAWEQLAEIQVMDPDPLRSDRMIYIESMIDIRSDEFVGYRVSGVRAES